MPKVSKLKLYITTKHGEDYDIWYNAQGAPKFSIKGLPEDFTNISPVSLSGYDTEESLRLSIQTAVTVYKQNREKFVKVIAYRASASAEISMNKFQEGGYSGHLPGVSKKIKSSLNQSEIANFGMSYKLLMEVDKTNEKVYHRIHESGKIGYSDRLGSEWQIMPWTEEREAFFIGIYENMAKMVVRMSLFIDADPEKAALLIESKQNLLQ